MRKTACFIFWQMDASPAILILPTFIKPVLTESTLTLLTPEDGNHQISLSPSGKYFVDSYSKPDVPPVTVLRNTDGKLIATLEKADISRLIATGWKPAITITVKAHDGQTDLYGLLFTPTNLDPNKKYPIIDYIYPGLRVVVWAVGHLSIRKRSINRLLNWGLL